MFKAGKNGSWSPPQGRTLASLKGATTQPVVLTHGHAKKVLEKITERCLYKMQGERRTVAKDNTLISRAQNGDEGAFTELMRAYYAFVYGIVIRIVKNPNDAEEIVQDTFLNTYRGLPQLEDTDKFKGWLTKVARNRSLNWLREQKIDTVSIDEVNEPTLQMSESPDEGLIREEQRELIRRAMETLSQKDRDIARSYYLDGASYDELIRTHGLSYKAISFRLSRAKQKLAKRLGHLRTGVFVFPVTTLKQMYSGGLTVMKIGTAPKITAGAVAIIVLAFIGTRQFMSSKADLSPSVEVVTSTPNQTANSVTQRGTTRKSAVTAPLPEDKPQISTEEMEQIEDFFAQLDEADPKSEIDTPQSLPDTEVAQNTDGHISTDTDAFADDMEQTAEEVMNAFVKAFKNLNFDAMGSLTTEEFGSMDLSLIDPEDLRKFPAEMRKMVEHMSEKILLEFLSRVEIVNSDYVGDEFHFELGGRPPEIPEKPEIPGMEISRISAPNTLFKMRKENDTWRVYGSETLD